MDAATVGGVSLPGTSALFLPQWFDDVCDGRIECEIFEGGASKGTALPAWIVTGKPAWSQAMPQIESLYQVARVMAVNRGMWPFERTTSFVRDVFPFIRAVERLRWTSKRVRGTPPVTPSTTVHTTAQPLVNKSTALADFADKANVTGRGLRRGFFDRLTYPRLPLHSCQDTTGAIDEHFGRAFLRMKAARPTAPKNMPMMWDTFIVGTTYWHVYHLSRDRYDDDYDRVGGIPAQPAFSTLTALEQLDSLNRAHMGSMLGGSNMPGLEVGFRVGQWSTWMMAFRIDHTKVNPGDLTASLSIPWPKDYSACSDQDTPLEWWPPARPIDINDVAGSVKRWGRGWEETAGNTPATAWKGLGFLKLHAASGEYRESERTLP